MQLRKLEINEHSLTRGLWERVFEEDSKEFLDYYYFIKTRDNQIYVIEEDGGIRSMLHLNPYMLQVEDKQFSCNYIIAVATEVSYRKRGYMGKVLRKSMMDMYLQKEPFTFLMPAAEAIYTPYDFQFVYAQNQSESLGAKGEPGTELSDAEMRNAGEMAAFFNRHFAEAYQVYALRDDKYYQTMIFEQQSENGGVKLLRKEGELVGMFAYACGEDRAEIREPLYLDAYGEDFQKAVHLLRKGQTAPAKLFAGRTQEDTVSVPIIMARILHLETMFSALIVREGEELDCSFAVLDTIITKNSRVWRLRNIPGSRGIQASETEDSEGVLTISALTSLLFGYKSIGELEEEENVILSDRLRQGLGKIQPLNRVYLNEIV